MNTLLENRELVTVRGASVSEQDNRSYLITSKETGAQVLIDAADNIEQLRALIASAAEDSAQPTRVVMIATTHQHWDHVRALKDLAAETGATTTAGTEDIEAIEKESGLRPEHSLEHDDVGQFPGFDLRAIHLRGHTPGSIAFVYEDPTGSPIILSGDSLFPGGVGNTWKDPVRFASLISDVSARLFDRYPDDAVVYPGHGDPTTLGAERPHLDEWRERGW
ncbi:glyoxylase-like metal-dependent hydrolase (beta-lactamase superfamily II) [Neomicrococcus aestuarii]|uniref:Glyoxylase-like metal-dependent hydrolase (Beta-lactamase superfamily II) n=1 Tax=Neomicrococcus aestuarii TaxID=556325 RepID=A0A7W8WZ22_9MICC|nr:MBL fold metallo-hydrolase [Neomicrococcus aestuarii]MBB5511807.1 glyoxylase-like metal-dependent hydrolase (beta-lactamase superfamily II) [Neomicrococcus aestuarii]